MKIPTEARITVSRDELQLHYDEFLSRHIGHHKQQSEMISEDREKHTRLLSQVEFTCYDCADSIRIDITEEARAAPSELGNHAIVDQHEQPRKANDPVTRLEKDGDKLYRVTYAEQSREEVSRLNDIIIELAKHMNAYPSDFPPPVPPFELPSVNYRQRQVFLILAWLTERGYLSDKIVKGGV